MNKTHITLFVGYVVLFLVVLVATAWWIKRQRKPKSPFKKTTKLLRGPGESLLKKIAEIDDQVPNRLMLGLTGPIILALFAGWGAHQLGLTDGNAPLWVAFGVLLVATVATCIWLVRLAVKGADYHLGYFGERVVAEALEPLKAAGWRIYHDVPGEIGKMKFNVDHVAIGPGGVFAIETKTRRKGGAVEGREDQKVTYDGKKLRWPWGDEEPYGVKNALDRARWLADWLERIVGKPVPVHAILTFPEWFVVEAPSRADPRLRVIPTSWLERELQEREPVLSERQIDFLARQLEQRCRDVEY